MSTPEITQLQVIPVAGRDSMLLNLSGAHGPFFTRNIVILTDSAGHMAWARFRAASGFGRRLTMRAICWSASQLATT